MTVTDHPPGPVCNVEAERAVLGAVLLGQGAVMDALLAAGLQAEDFYREHHGVIWTAMRELHARGRGVDFLVLTEWLRGTGRLERVGGRVAVDLLSGAVPLVGNAVEYARIVMGAARWRRTLHAALELQSAVVGRDRVEARGAVERLAREWLS